ncbi:MAG: MarR family winged helix-turn-helix transcriptional regulator [Acidimicrobiales bacterium]
MSDLCGDSRVTAFGMLLEAHAALTASIGRDLETQAGMPLTWFEVLIRLARSPERSLRMSDLASQVALSTSGLTRVIDRMEHDDLVNRKACPKDRRVFYALLTDAGSDALEKAIPAHINSLEKYMAEPLGLESLAKLTEYLRVLRDNALAPINTTD